MPRKLPALERVDPQRLAQLPSHKLIYRRTVPVSLIRLLIFLLLFAGSVSGTIAGEQLALNGQIILPRVAPALSTTSNVKLESLSGQDRFESVSASRRTRDKAEWVVNSGDNHNLPFIIVDKVNAEVYAFDASGHLYEAAPALLGLGRGDFTAPGVGKIPLLQIPPAERTTPAGRFVSKIVLDSHGEEVLLLNYDIALTLHAVIEGTPEEHRAERLASTTPSDNRISFGCINVPKPFFKNVIQSKFSGTNSIVYILPEVVVEPES